MIPFSIRRLPSFDKLFNTLSRRAVRLGLSAPTYKVVGERTEQAEVYYLSENEQQFSHTETVIVHDIEIEGLDPVRLNGWSFAAVVETVKGKDNLIFGVGGEVPDRYLTSGCVCEHCNTKRNRFTTFIVKHENGDFKQVGKSCLRDFVGNDSPEHLASLFEFFGDIYINLNNLRDSEMSGWEGGSCAYDVLDTLSLSIATQRVFGWLSRSKAYENGGTATADRVRLLMKKPIDEVKVTDEDRENAHTAINYFASLSQAATEGNTLSNNARILCNAGYCSDRSFGLVCALWVCYRVEKDKASREAAKDVRRATSKHLWEIGKRIKGIEATIERINHFETAYGISTLTILVDREGNVLTAKDLGHQEGDNVRFTATIKEHSEYDGVKQTVLLRAAKIELLDENWEVVKEEEEAPPPHASRG